MLLWLEKFPMSQAFHRGFLSRKNEYIVPLSIGVLWSYSHILHRSRMDQNLLRNNAWKIFLKFALKNWWWCVWAAKWVIGYRQAKFVESKCHFGHKNSVFRLPHILRPNGKNRGHRTELLKSQIERWLQQSKLSYTSWPLFPMMNELSSGSTKFFSFYFFSPRACETLLTYFDKTCMVILSSLSSK